jgi:hypothetical protein
MSLTKFVKPVQGIQEIPNEYLELHNAWSSALRSVYSQVQDGWV